jgi:hypothetical protein
MAAPSALNGVGWDVALALAVKNAHAEFAKLSAECAERPMRPPVACLALQMRNFGREKKSFAGAGKMP